MGGATASRLTASGLGVAGTTLGISGGTDTHMVLLDLRGRGLTGDRAELALEAAGILVNRNAIPFDPQPVRITSGIRLGTTTLAVRGMGPAEAEAIAGLIAETLGAIGDEAVLTRVREAVAELCRRFPLEA
jgi:glycine hydroxymethyltransferase